MSAAISTTTVLEPRQPAINEPHSGQADHLKSQPRQVRPAFDPALAQLLNARSKPPAPKPTQPRREPFPYD